MLKENIPEGLCQCGCGGSTGIAPQNSQEKNWVKGKHFKCIKGHNLKGLDYQGKCRDCGEPWKSSTHARCYKCQEKRRLVRLNRPRNCVYCGENFLANRGLNSRFCSLGCKYKHQKESRVSYCAACNAPIYGLLSYRSAACSRKCAGILRKQKHPSLAERRYTYMQNNEWHELSKSIIARDEKKCIIPDCGSLFPKLNVDHLFPFRLVRSWGADPNDLKNLNTLCSSHHAEKTAIERKLFAGDWLGFLSGMRLMHFPPERMEEACKLYNVARELI